MSVDEMTVDKMSVDEMSVGEMTCYQRCNPFSISKDEMEG